MAYKFTVVAGKTQELPQFLDWDRLWPILHLVQSGRICADTLGADDMVKVRELRMRGDALAELDF